MPAPHGLSEFVLTHVILAPSAWKVGSGAHLLPPLWLDPVDPLDPVENSKSCKKHIFQKNDPPEAG